MNGRMSMREPGLDLHEWETRWAEIETALAEDPARALVEACDLVEETIGVESADDETRAAFRAVRDTADAIERGDDVDPGDIGAAVENLRRLRDSVGSASS